MTEYQNKLLRKAQDQIKKAEQILLDSDISNDKKIEECAILLSTVNPLITAAIK